MKPNEYLEAILNSQCLDEKSAEVDELRRVRGEVEALLRKKFEKCSLTIRYGGSKAKGTMVKPSYDLDVICYFPHEEKGAGVTLKAVFNSVKNALASQYTVTSKTTALRLHGLGTGSGSPGPDFHVDVVPGRFVDASETDAHLHVSDASKDFLKTNLDVHIDHVKDSGVRDAIKLMKLWRWRNGIQIRTFVLELLTIKLLSGMKSSSLADQLTQVWTELRDQIEDISVEDPANPAGNDLSPAFGTSEKSQLQNVARTTLQRVEMDDWVSVFGPVPTAAGSEPAKISKLKEAAAGVPTPVKPWSPK